MATETPICDFGWPAPDFALPGIDGHDYSYKAIAGPKGTVVMFICNHCPYVKAIAARLVSDIQALKALGIGVVAINANDAVRYPADSFDAMKVFSAQHGFGFPYLYDESQEVARAYDAVCTPDFFGINAAGELQYRGRLDQSNRETAPEGAPRELVEAMTLVAKTGKGPTEQIASMGCSIKWKEG